MFGKWTGWCFGPEKFFSRNSVTGDWHGAYSGKCIKTRVQFEKSNRLDVYSIFVVPTYSVGIFHFKTISEEFSKRSHSH